MLYMVTFTINIPPMLAYIPYMDPMGYTIIPISLGRICQIQLRRWLQSIGAGTESRFWKWARIEMGQRSGGYDIFLIQII